MAILRGATILLLAVAGLGCGADPDRPSRAAQRPPLDGLVLLSGTTDAGSLVTWETGGAQRDLPLADPGTAWLSANRHGRLLVTLADGTLRRSTLLTSGDPLEWQPTPDEDADLPREPLYFATWSPDGLAAAAIATDLRDRWTLVIIDPLEDATLEIAIDPATIPAPPAWLDDDRVVIDSGEQTSVVNTQTREIVPGPAGVGLLAVSADGERTAVARPDGSAIDVRTTAAWLAGETAAEASLDGDGRVGALALDRRGQRLAAIWERSDGPSLITVYERDGTSWREVDSRGLPDGAVRGVVSWLP
jgi:hypothetical protein